MNRAFTTLTGYSAEEAIGLSHHLLSSGRQGEGFYAELWTTIERGEVWRGELVNRRKDGTLYEEEMGITPLRDEQGRTTHYVAVKQDITARKRAEEALRQSEAQFRDLAQAIPQLVWIAKSDGYHEYFNTGCHDYLGMSFDQLAGTGWLDCLHPDDRQRTLDRWDHSLRTGEPYEIEYRLRRASDGTYRWFLGRALPIRDQRGAIVRWFGTCTDIDEQKRAEERLEQRVRDRTMDLARALEDVRRGKERLEKVLEVETVGVMFWDLTTGRMTDANDTFLQMTGYSRSDVEAGELTWQKLTPPEYTEASLAEIRKFSATGRVGPYEKEYLRKDGTRQWLVFAGSSLGTNTCVEFCVDIADQKQAEAALRESEERLRFALETSHTGAWDLDLVDHTAFRSPEHDRIFGYADLLPKWTYEMFLAHVLPEDRQAVDEKFRQATASQSDWSFECRIRRVDGAVRWIWAAGRHRADAAGQISRMAGIVQDITERKLAEEAVRENEQRLKLAQQAAKIGAFEWNLQTNVNTWTPELEAMYGLAPGQFGKTESAWEQLVHPEDRAATLERVQEAFRTGEPAENEWRVIWPDGSVHWIMGRFQVLKDAQGKPLRLSGVNIDITERKQAEEMAAAGQVAELARAAAEQANQAKDHFLAVLSHELRTPLTPVLPVLEELARQVPEAAREDIEMAQRNVELEARLIDDLLDVTRISRGKIELHRETVDLCTVMRRAAEVCAPDIEARRLHFGIKVEGGPYPVEADPARLQQVFWNLIRNAIKFTPHGGCVGIHCQSLDGQVMTHVKDSGIGIEPEALVRIFNTFEQMDRSVTRQFGGLGLGLAISKTLVELHGGTIQAKSEGKGKGATFTVTLPIHKLARAKATTPEAGQAARVTAPTPAVARPLEILLVEDHGDTARVMRRMLQARGHRVETAGDVATALELARERRFDLLLSDLGLPDRTGLELMQELRQMGQHLPGIALSGYGQEEDTRRSREVGFGEHLTKPVNFAQLEAAIERVATPTQPGA